MEYDYYIELYRIYVGVRINCNIFKKKRIEKLNLFLGFFKD